MSSGVHACIWKEFGKKSSEELKHCVCPEDPLMYISRLH